MSPARWLIDKSALWRTDVQAVQEVVEPAVMQGLVGVSIATELELGYSARSESDYLLMRRTVVDRLLPVALPLRTEARARDVQRALVERGQHRAVSIPDLLIAATAEAEGLTVWHYDADFDLIAEVTGQAVEWIVPRGSI